MSLSRYRILWRTPWRLYDRWHSIRDEWGIEYFKEWQVGPLLILKFDYPPPF